MCFWWGKYWKYTGIFRWISFLVEMCIRMSSVTGALKVYKKFPLNLLSLYRGTWGRVLSLCQRKKSCNDRMACGSAVSGTTSILIHPPPPYPPSCPPFPHTTSLLAKWLRCPPQEQKMLFDSRLHHRDFFKSLHTSDLKTGMAVSTLPGVWRCKVSAWTGWPGVSILWLGEVENLICNFYLSVVAPQLSRSVPEIH